MLFKQKNITMEPMLSNLHNLLVAVTEAAKLFLARSVPAVEFEWATVGVERKRVDLYSKGG
jgi:hypothetical protein